MHKKKKKKKGRVAYSGPMIYESQYEQSRQVHHRSRFYKGNKLLTNRHIFHQCRSSCYATLMQTCNQSDQLWQLASELKVLFALVCFFFSSFFLGVVVWILCVVLQRRKKSRFFEETHKPHGTKD